MKTLILIERVETTMRVPDDAPETLDEFLEWYTHNFLDEYITNREGCYEELVVVD